MSQSVDPDTDARTTLRLIGPDPANWVPDRPDIDHNVAILGGGQTGCALSLKSALHSFGEDRREKQAQLDT